MKALHLLLAIFSFGLFTGCATKYVTPGGHANLSQISDPKLREHFAAKPAAGFPAGIAAARVQEPGYRNYHTDLEGGVYGRGKYSVVLVKEVEDEADLERLGKLPQVNGLISLSRLLLPERLDSDQDLRDAAARLKADMLLLYTFDTAFREEDKSTALTVITLGNSPTRKISVHVGASALLIDTRTGFIYSAYEANEKRDIQTSAWRSEESADRARRDAEQAAFKKLVSEFEKSWAQVVERAKQGA